MTGDPAEGDVPPNRSNAISAVAFSATPAGAAPVVAAVASETSVAASPSSATIARDETESFPSSRHEQRRSATKSSASCRAQVRPLIPAPAYEPRRRNIRDRWNHASWNFVQAQSGSASTPQPIHELRLPSPHTRGTLGRALLSRWPAPAKARRRSRRELFLHQDAAFFSLASRSRLQRFVTLHQPSPST